MSNSNTLPMQPVMFCRSVAAVTCSCYCPDTGAPMMGQPALEVTFRFPNRVLHSPTVFYSWNSRMFEIIEYLIEDGTAVMIPEQER